MQLNPQQLRAVMSPNRAILVLATAGSGKTSCLIERIVRLISGGISPYQILAITFTRKAAKMLSDRLAAKLSPEIAKKISVGTSHSFCAKIIRDYAELIGYTRDFGVYDEHDNLDILKTIVKEFRLSVDLSAYSDKICRGRTDNLDAHEKRLRDEYLFRLRRFNMLDYDLILEKAVEILGKLRAAGDNPYAKKFKYLFFDEFQDIAEMEDRLLLSLEIENSFAIGDFSQEIYRFRGTSNEYMIKYQDRHLAAGGFELIDLPINYRSVPAICAAAERLINHNPQPFGVYRVVPARPADNDCPLNSGLDSEDEAAYISFRLKAALRTDNPKDWAILVRTNRQIEELRERLVADEIPLQVIRRNALFGREEVRTVLSFLRVIVNPADDYSLTKVLRTPAMKVPLGTRNEIKVLGIKNDISLHEACKRTPAVAHVAWEIERFRGTAGFFVSAADIFNRFVSESVYVASLREQYLWTRLESLKDLGEAITEFMVDEEREDKTLAGWLSSLTMDAAIDAWDESKEAVSLMTIHSAKGLEFRKVILAGCDDTRLPLNGANIEEERRLMFVAVTRAMDHLVITSPTAKKGWGGSSTPVIPSRFIKEMGDATV